MKAPYEKVDIKPFNYAISLIGGKWKMHILFYLWKYEDPGVPPKVEYYLSEKGQSLMPVLQCVCQWGHEHIPADMLNTKET